MGLPVEIWIRVLELLGEHPTLTARCPCIQRFVQSVENYDQTEKAALKYLPSHERKAWLYTKHYCAINLTSRTVAQRINLTKSILTNLRQLPENLYLACPGRDLPTSATSIFPLPPSLTIDLYTGTTLARHLFRRQCFGLVPATSHCELAALEDVVKEHLSSVKSMAENWALCCHVTRFELLAGMVPGREHLLDAAMEGAGRIGKTVEEIWWMKGAVVEVIISL
jgi:hypothetical protein